VNGKTLIIVLTLLVGLCLTLYSWRMDTPQADCGQQQADQKKLMQQRYRLSRGFQTSASYLTRVATLEACLDPQNERKQQQLTLIQDLSIKSSSYALMNKLFFILSLIFAFCIISFPIISNVVSSDSRLAKIFSPTQLPAITLLAGLCFGLYTDYKGKQTSAENLMRYVYAAPASESISEISRKLRQGLAEIDNGHDFSEVFKTADKP
jgi:hypothetical protein